MTETPSPRSRPPHRKIFWLVAMFLVLVGSAFAAIWPKNQDSLPPLNIKSSGRLPPDFSGAGETHRSSSHLGSRFAGFISGKGRSDTGHDLESSDEDGGRSNTGGGNWRGTLDANGPGRPGGPASGEGDAHFGPGGTGFFPFWGAGGMSWNGAGAGNNGKDGDGNAGDYGDPGQGPQNTNGNQGPRDASGDGSKDTNSDPSCTGCGLTDDSPPGFSSKDGDPPQDLPDDPGCADCDLPPPGDGLASDPPHQPVRIPEPSSLLLLAPALVALRKKKRR